MKLVTIVAGSAAEALAEVHRQLGPEAVVVNVRKTPAPGLSKIWKKPQIEVQATLPNPKPAPPKRDLSEIYRAYERAKEQRSATASPQPRRPPAPPAPVVPPRQPVPPIKESREPKLPEPNEEIGLGRMLENLGLLPLHAQWLVDQVHARQFGEPQKNLRDQFVAVQELLVEFWSRLAARVESGTGQTRILVGAPGVGKTTCLCKWLTQEVLLEKRSARVWRLDGHTANTAEFLSIHGEILGVPVDRVWSPEESKDEAQVEFVDLPGAPIDDTESIAGLASQIQNFQPAQVFLVLNSAYDLNHLIEQARAFSVLPLAGLILTHLDEDSRWSKFWNLLLGTKLPVVFLSGGLNIPGDFAKASPQSLFDIGLERGESA
ncbi:MAG: hypothetical protein FJ398_23975 [Verrucomicrobia bacterium]|nr:hypothetical protein [Verrucomicrobiota bacterium]